MKASSLHVVKSNPRDIEQDLPELPKEIAALWEVVLLYGKDYRYSELTYAVQLKTKLVGGAKRCYLVIELQDKFDEILRELNIFGVMERAQLITTIQHVKQLKIHGIYQEVPDLTRYLDGASDDTEARELYEQVMLYVHENMEVFPTVSSEAYGESMHMGVILDIDPYIRKFGKDTIGISREALCEILDLQESYNANRLNEIVRSWLNMGLLIKKNSQGRLQESFRPVYNYPVVNRFYVLRMMDVTE